MVGLFVVEIWSRTQIEQQHEEIGLCSIGRAAGEGSGPALPRLALWHGKGRVIIPSSLPVLFFLGQIPISVPSKKNPFHFISSIPHSLRSDLWFPTWCQVVA
ncbi:hypothetical protein PAHAL_9G085100 [Panicum hallii]|uniref:Uncharacterized protein n=1 Tax=Panicum hallii TaxID=206008 RepID=A0A2T8I0K8_9POAL|nr:hypothetical protein PAHAL_9G085100 [Panicum hallii]